MEWILPSPKFATGTLLERVLQARGIATTQRAGFLNPTRTDIRSFTELHDTHTAAAVLVEAIAAGKKIVIHGDYDVDGVVSTAILWDFLHRHMGADVLPFIPSRYDEGYGLTPQSLDGILSQGAQVVVTVDCGIRDIALVEEYTKRGLTFIITDHHALATVDGQTVVPPAAAVVHPRYPGHEVKFPDICGAAVAWKFIQAIIDVSGVQADADRYLDLVALATVCDVMPLTDENRAIVRLGIEQMRHTQNVGLHALLQEAGVEADFVSSYHCGFVIGPRLNAAGRVGSPLQALRLLTTQQPKLARQLASELQQLNVQRQTVTATVMQAAEAQIAAQPDAPLHFVYAKDWPEGIIGLVAGKLSEKYGKPVIIGTEQEGQVVASARSPIHYHITEALGTQAKLLARFGGHAQAAGLTVTLDQVQQLQQQLLEHAKANINAASAIAKLHIDAIADPAQVIVDEIRGLDALEPFGATNPKPLFYVSNINLGVPKSFGSGQEHVRFASDSLSGAEIVAFRKGAELKQFANTVVDIVGTLNINSWRGTHSPQIIVEDIRPSR